MTKKKRKQLAPTRAKARYFTPDDPTTPRRFVEDMIKVDALTKKKHWQEALDVLTPLNRRYPHQPDVLGAMTNMYYELGDMPSYQRTTLEMLELEPDDPTLLRNLAGAYMLTMRPVLALQTYRRFMQLWPNHAYAAEAREVLEKLETEVPRIMAEVGIADDAEGMKLAVLHEELQVYLAQGELDKAQQAAQALLKIQPHFAPAHNNLSLAHWMNGNLEAALQAAQQVLTYEPDNVHALANLIHFLYVSGQVDEARSYAEALRASPVPASEKRLKQMEGFTFLEDYPAVLTFFEQARAEGDLDFPQSNPMYFHLAAVAIYRQGDEAGARRLWQEALGKQRGFQPAQDNLADLKRPAAERNGVWEFPFNNWVSWQVSRDIEAAVRPAATHGNERMAKNALRHYLQQHPEFQSLFANLLRRGDPAGRQFVLNLARLAETPELSAMLREFAFSPYGPDKLRLEIMNWLAEHGEMPSGTHRMYMQGEWRDDILFLGFAIGDESEDGEPLSGKVRKLTEQATLALQAGDWRKAQPLLEQALELAPDAPTLLNNLATAYEMQGRSEEARAMIRDIHARFPNYLFARVTLARIATLAGELERAHDLLDPLLQRRKLHFSEFHQMMGVFIDLYIAEGKKDAAKQWLQLWEQYDPQNPQIAMYKMRLGITNFKQLFGLGQRRR